MKVLRTPHHEGEALACTMKNLKSQRVHGHVSGTIAACTWHTCGSDHCEGSMCSHISPTAAAS